MRLLSGFCLISSLIWIASCNAHEDAAKEGLVGYWTLQGDCQDHSGHGRHGKNHGVDLETSAFDGRGAYVEVASTPSLDLGKGDFTVAAEIEVRTEDGVDDVVGDIVSKFDLKERRGFSLTFASNTSGYNSQSDVRQLFFGIDDNCKGEWIDCGRPGGVAYSSDALTVFDGSLYAGTSDAPDEKDWAHVFRYAGGQRWEDCGRVGEGKTRGVYAMIVHDGALYAGTAGPHSGSKANTGDYGRVYRYRGGKSWEDVGQPGKHYRINSLASYRGRLYACAIDTYGTHGGVYVLEEGNKWTQCGDFGRPHTTSVNDGQLFAAFPNGEVFDYDGSVWKNLHNPYGALDLCNQLHAQGVFNGELYVGTWPLGKVAVRREGQWVDMGRLGDATEVVQLLVYNGSLYGGSIPRAEVFRFDGVDQWTSLGRLFDPKDYDAKEDVEDWSRASSMRLFQGKMFCSTATCYRALIEQPRPNDPRGKVFCYETGPGVSFDRNLASGWRHVAAVRSGDSLKLYVDGKLVAENSTATTPISAASDAPLRIGFGSQAHFNGKIREVRLYDRAVGEAAIEELAGKVQK
ncbi:LamG domain-containing protein [Lacipirellula sp.]|uniref:LamG domain-containing protein n=1 Tax=Lacipirellula sp. TaxID=2691419 RepID=UPI003D14BEB3